MEHIGWLPALAWFEFCALRFRLLGPEAESAQFSLHFTVIHDLSGELLLSRHSLLSGEDVLGYVDIALAAELGNPLQSVVLERVWSEAAATQFMAQHYPGKPFRFVMYDYPKIGVEVEASSELKKLFALPDFTEVPEPATDEFGETLLRTQWSLLNSMSTESRNRSLALLEKWIYFLRNRLAGQWATSQELLKVLARFAVSSFVQVEEVLVCSSVRTPNTCFTLHPQRTGKWCSAACVQMVLDYFRFSFQQEFLADELELGTSTGTAKPLQCSRQLFLVVEVLEKVTLNALRAWLNPCRDSFWGTIVGEVKERRPTILFSEGHARVIVGYRTIRVDDPTVPPIRSLMLYDPLDVCKGHVEESEGYNSAKYTVLFGVLLERFSAPIVMEVKCE